MLLYEYQVHGFKIKVSDSLSDNQLSQSWEGLTKSAQHLRSEMLILLEKAKPIDLHFRYLFIYPEDSDSKPCGIIYLQLLQFNHRNFNFSEKSYLQSLARIILKLKSFRILMAGCLFSVDFSPVVLDQTKINPELLLNILDAYAKYEKFDALLLKDMPGKFNRELLATHGYKPFETDLTMQLEINPDWKTFKDYERALTHKYAQRVRKIRKQAVDIKRKQISKHEFILERSRFMDLFYQVSGKQTIRMGIIDHVYFEELFDTLGSNFVLIGYFENDKLIAFASHILYKDKLEVHYIGIDYTCNSHYALYFNILYDGIMLAIEYEKSSLELGRTAREAKAVVGCHPIYFNDYVKISNSFVNWLVNLLSKYFNQSLGDGWKKRHPFKTIATGIAEK